jgi:uncharacterized protein YjbI with pentapeptide repeats
MPRDAISQLQNHFTGRAAAAKGHAGYDNPRENIDPHVKTKVIDTKEIVQNGVSYDLSTIGGVPSGCVLSGSIAELSGMHSNLSGQMYILSGVNYGSINTLSGAHNNLSGQFYILSGVAYGSINALSGMHSVLSGQFYNLSGSNNTYHISLSGILVNLSGAYYGSPAVPGLTWLSGGGYTWPVLKSDVISGTNYRANTFSGINLRGDVLSGNTLMIAPTIQGTTALSGGNITGKQISGAVCVCSPIISGNNVYGNFSGGRITGTQISGSVCVCAPFLSGNYIKSNTITELSGTYSNLSGVYYAHALDSSDPHGATLTQTIISISSGAVTGDKGTSGSLYIPGILYNTTSGGLTVANYPIGSLLVVYTA